MAGDPSIKFPGPTAQEQKLQDEQVKLLRQQRDALSEQMRQQNLLAPLLWGAAGITPEYDKDQKIVGFKETPDELEPLRKQIEKGGLERSLAAMRGELPENPALLRDLADQEKVMHEQLRKQLGPGYLASTPGQTALGEFMQRKNSLLDASRRGDLTLGEALSITRQDQQQNQLNQFMQRAGSVNQLGFGAAGAFGQAAAGYSNPLALMLQAREGEFGANALRYQYDADNPFSGRNLFRQGHSDLRTAASMGASYGMSASTARLKKHITPLEPDEYRKALKKIRDTPITRWLYEWEDDRREPHIGPILELSPKEIRADDTHVSLLDYLGLSHAAIKGLDRDVQSLRAAMGKTNGHRR